ncbi:MAG: protein kinase, partial [Gammaproteobacteria bacterium]|nr:protein kinase [Gammaproteobacteria bacterium]
MINIKESLDAFIQGRIDFNGLLEIVQRTATEAPEQIPELIDRINALYRAGRLPPQLYSALLAQAGGNTPTAPSRSPADSDSTAPESDTSNADDTAPNRESGASDQTRIATPSIVPEEASDRTRIATPSSITSEEPEHTRITTRPPVTTPRSAEAPDQTRIATAPLTGAPTGQIPTAETGTGSSPASSSSWGKTTGTRTATRKISNEPAVGDILKDRFVLEEELGRGGMGIVFKALDKRKEEASDRHPYVALKLLNESFKQHKDSLMALQREARKAQDLKHPNVISIFDFDKDGHDNYFIAMELLDGHPLDKTIKSLRGTGMPKKKALSLIAQMGQALAAAHNHKPGIIHSDFKPGNVFLTTDDQVKVFDFGIARAAKPKAGEAKGDVTAFDARTLGALTPTYASLEMLEGQDPDPRDDIYALAIVAYELLSGSRPFGRKPANEALTEQLTPQRIEGLTRRQWKGLQRGLAFRREDRAVSVEAFLDDLKYRKSKTPLILAISGIGLGLASWLLVPPYLEKRREAALATTIEQAVPNEMATLLQQSADLPESSKETLDNKVIQRLIALITDGQAEQITAT